jgi:predicted aspartyl protease
VVPAYQGESLSVLQPAGEVGVMVRSIILAARVLLFLVLVSGSSLNATDVSSASNTTAPFELGFDFLVIVHGRVGDLDGLKFILDTGSSHTVIDENVAHRLRLPRRPGKITNFDRDIPIEWMEIGELRAGPIRAARANVIVAKLNDYSEFTQGVDGIIGLDLLSRGKKLSIDYERHVVSFEAADTQDGGPAASQSFVVPIAVQGVRMSLIVDTGLRYVMLYKDRLRKGLPNVRTEGESRAAVIGRLHATQVNLPGVKIVGPETVATVFLIDEPENGNLFGIDGYLGPLSLHATRIELDFAGHRLRWQ